MTGVIVKKEKLGTQRQTHAEERHAHMEFPSENESRDEGDASVSQGHRRLPATTRS